MARLDARKVALRLMEAQKNNGYSYRWFLRRMWMPYLLGAAFLVPALWLSTQIGHSGFFLFILGLLMGMWLRDYGVILASKKSWPVLKHVLDWEKVKQIADGHSTL